MMNSSDTSLGNAAPTAKHRSDEKPSISGLMIVGSRAQCGKSAITAGLAGAFLSHQLNAQAIKPINFEPCAGELEDKDQELFEYLMPAYQKITPIRVPSPFYMTRYLWGQLIENCKTMACPVLIEAPGSVATPLRFDTGDEAQLEHRMQDAFDLAYELDLPILVVTRKHPRVMEEVAPAFTYAYEGRGDVLGWVAVETEPVPCPEWDEHQRFISREYQVPFLGLLPYSPHIQLQQGLAPGLVQLTEEHIDLLPIQQALRFANV